GIRDFHVTGVQTCALPILPAQAAINNNGKINNNKNPTSSLQLISLNADDVPLDNGADDFSDIADMLESADQVDDSIDAVADESRSEERRVGKECRSRGSV